MLTQGLCCSFASPPSPLLPEQRVPEGPFGAAGAGEADQGGCARHSPGAAPGTACAGTATPIRTTQERASLQGAGVAQGTLGASWHSQSTGAAWKYSRSLQPDQRQGSHQVPPALTPALGHLRGSGCAGTGRAGCPGEVREERDGKRQLPCGQLTHRAFWSISEQQVRGFLAHLSTDESCCWRGSAA